MATIEEVLAKVAAIPAPPQPFVNPYAGHRALSEQDQELLGEYARLAGTIHRVAALSTVLSASHAHAHLLSQLRVLERKMGLVLTLFKASVWAIVQDQQDQAEAEALALAAEADAGARRHHHGTGVDAPLDMGLGLNHSHHHYAAQEGGDGGDSLFIENADVGDETLRQGYRY